MIDFKQEHTLTLFDILLIIFISLGFGCGIGLFINWAAWLFFSLSIIYGIYRIMEFFKEMISLMQSKGDNKNETRL